MKKIIFKIFLFLISIQLSAANLVMRSPVKATAKVSVNNDSFYYHYKILDSSRRGKTSDSSKHCIEAIAYMEKLTGLKANSSGGWAGWHFFAWQDVENWGLCYEYKQQKEMNAGYVNKKVDSVFKFYFRVLEMAIDASAENSGKVLLYDNSNKEEDKNNFLDKYKIIAQSFIEGITQIKVPTSRIYPRAVSKEFVTVWKEWYLVNKTKILWNEEEKLPVL